MKFPIDIQYNIVLAILYAIYCPMQIPSNMVCSSSLSGAFFPPLNLKFYSQFINRISR